MHFTKELTHIVLHKKEKKWKNEILVQNHVKA